MDLKGLYGASFVSWENVAASWTKRTVASRLLLFAARRLLQEPGTSPDPARDLLEETALPDEVKLAFSSPPAPESAGAAGWGAFVDAAVAAELETVSYGERPPLLNELRAGLLAAADEAGRDSDLGLWFVARHDALPGTDLPEDSSYLPV